LKLPWTIPANTSTGILGQSETILIPMQNTLYRDYLKPEILSKINNLELRAKLVVEGFITGLHRSPFHGFSVEFSQHRPYNPGDSLRFIDWKVFARTDRFYIKQYEEETNLKSYVLLDCSQSMTFTTSGISKLQYGKYLAAALIYLMLMQRDAVGLVVFDSQIRKIMPARSTVPYLQVLLSELDGAVPGADTDIGSVLHNMAERIKRKGLLILISDLLDIPEKIISGLRHFRHNKHEVLVFQLLDPRERQLDFKGEIQFEDLESGEKITTQPWYIKRDYQQKIEEYIRYMKSECRTNRIDYQLIDTDYTLDLALMEYLIKRRKLI
jgi:uncharacterized protein (DUF58 family)